MNRYIIDLYLAFRYYQYLKQEKPDIQWQEAFENYQTAINTGNMQLFDKPDLSEISSDQIKDIELPVNILYSISFNFSNGNRLKKFNEIIRQIINSIDREVNSEYIISKNKFATIVKNLMSYQKLCMNLDIFDPNIIKIAYETLVLRVCLIDDEQKRAILLRTLFVIEETASPDYDLLYKLTGEEYFLGKCTQMSQDTRVWDYIAALAGDSRSLFSIGEKLINLAFEMPAKDLEQIKARNSKIAKAAFFLNDTKSGQDLLVSRLNQYKDIVLHQKWLLPCHKDKKKLIDNILSSNPEAAYFIFNDLNLAKITHDELSRICILYRIIIEKKSVYFAVLQVRKFFSDSYNNKEDFELDLEARLVEVDALDGCIDVFVSENSDLTSQEKQKIFFAKRIASDDCPVIAMPFIGFNRHDGIINLETYDNLTTQLLGENLACCRESIYEKQTFETWVASNKRDIVDSSYQCNGSDSFEGKYENVWLNMFLNLKRLKQTILLKIVKNDWFIYNKLELLIRLEPELFKPHWFRYIESLDIQNLQIMDIFYINAYFKKNGNLPLEIMLFRQCDGSFLNYNPGQEIIEANIFELFAGYIGQEKRFVRLGTELETDYLSVCSDDIIEAQVLTAAPSR